MSGMIIGGGPVAQEGGFKAYLLMSGKVVCFEEEKVGADIFWKFPLVLENVQDREGGVKSYFRPLIPFGKDTKFKQTNVNNLVCEVLDENLKNGYMKTVQGIRLQLSGIEVVPANPEL